MDRTGDTGFSQVKRRLRIPWVIEKLLEGNEIV
jgi:hypothetical protein